MDYAKKLQEIYRAATRWPRCCDQWQDGLGGMHCRDCSQKTFAMLFDIQQILGVNKGCNPLDINPEYEAMMADLAK